MAGIRRISAFLTLMAGLGLAAFVPGQALYGADVSTHTETGAGPVRIHIGPEAQVSVDRIYLKDVAVIQANAALQKKIGAIDLGTAPKPGKTRTIPGQWIASYLRSGNRIPDAAQVTVSEKLQILRASQVISEKRLKAIFEAHIAANGNGAECRLRRFKVRGQKTFPVGKIELRTTNGRPKREFGNVSLKVTVLINGKESGRISLSGWVDRFEPAVCAARYLPKDTLLTIEDLRLVPVNVAKSSTDLVLTMDEVIGKRLKHRLAAGVGLRATMIAAPPLIYKGDRVKLVAQTGALKVITLGIAKNPGGKGDQIHVENMTSKKTVVGRVADEATVEVLF